jgi:hypothetical protein
MRLMRLFAITAVIAGSIVGFAAPASADTLCEQAWLRGQLVNPTYLGTCTLYESPFCEFQVIDALTQLVVYVNVCLPPDTP